MITKSEIGKLLSLLGRCSYNDPNKQEFKRLSMKLLREVNKLGNFNAEIRFNKGGKGRHSRIGIMSISTSRRITASGHLRTTCITAPAKVRKTTQAGVITGSIFSS